MSRLDDLRAVARRVLAPDDLLRGYSGDEAGAARQAAARYNAGRVATVEWESVGGRVAWRVGDIEGATSMRDLVRVAVATAARGAAEQLAAAVEHRRDVQRRAALAGPLRDADREVAAALEVWWDGQPGVQLDLFGAAS